MVAKTLSVLVLLIALAACDSGSSSDQQSVSPSPSDASTFGRVDVGGYELAWMCEGEGSPTIIAEAGYDSAGTSTYFESMGPMSDISPGLAPGRLRGLEDLPRSLHAFGVRDLSDEVDVSDPDVQIVR